MKWEENTDKLIAVYQQINPKLCCVLILGLLTFLCKI